MLYENFYDGLTEAQIKICEALTEYAKQWGISVRRRCRFIGFGKRESGFYMFCLSWMREPYFKARVDYSYEQSREPISLSLSAENAEAIFAAARAITEKRYTLDDEQPKGAQGDLPRGPQAVQPYPYDRAAIAARAFGVLNAVSVESPPPHEDSLRRGRELCAKADELLELLSTRIFTVRKRAIWKKYMLSDGETLETVAADYGVTRERIRQLVAAANKSLARLFESVCCRGADEAQNACLHAIRKTLCEADIGVLLGFYSGFSENETRKRRLVMGLLLGKGADDRIEEARLCIFPRPPQRQKRGQTSQQLSRIREQICYPTAVFADPTTPVSAFTAAKTKVMTEKFKQMLIKMADALEFVQNPNIVYYSSSVTDHRPDFLLQFDDGRRVLVLVLPTINMGFIYNLKRFKMLHGFCEKNGYGYLIVDGGLQSFAQVSATEVDDGLKEALNAVLRAQGQILWPDICELKGRYAISNATIVAYVIQENRCFVMDPYFCIK